MGRLVKGKNDLETWCRQNDRNDLLLEWNIEKNHNLSVSDVAYGSAKPVWWKGECGHEWQALVNARTGSGFGCPYCSGKRVLIGFNDLSTLYPDVANEWHPTKNGNLRPSDVTSYSKKKVWWICRKGHEWQSAIGDRTRKGCGCPACSKEYQTSFPEQALYYYVFRYFRDAISGDMHLGSELDIYIPSKRVAIEFDGLFWHKTKTKKDLKKNHLCIDNNITMLRVRERGLEPVDSCVVFEIEPRSSDKELSRTIESVLQYLGVELSVDIEKDKLDIISSYINVIKSNSLLAKYPNIAKDWHPTKNGGISPDMISFGSDKDFWWKGDCGHEWKTSPNKRVSNGTNCPYCSGRKVLIGFNDLKSQKPDLALEWDYERNVDLNPENLTIFSGRSVWWTCSKGHHWKSQIAARTRGNGCPYCSNQKLLKGYNDLQTVFPDLSREWHPTKNHGLIPSDFVYGSMQKVWWLCKTCAGEWETTISKRTFRGDGCPYCSKGGGKKLRVGCNDLKTLHPDLAKQWNYNKNLLLSPSEVISGSHMKVWWECPKGHEYRATIGDRISKRSGCPYCSNQKILQGFNDLLTKCPELAKEWDYSKNDGLEPTSVGAGAHKVVWWICPKGHSFQSSIVGRTRKKLGCPVCSGYVHPRIMCIETGAVYDLGADASRATGIDVSSINQCCKGKRKTAGGFHWKYVD